MELILMKNMCVSITEFHTKYPTLVEESQEMGEEKINNDF